MDLNLKGKTAIVTGGSLGIGKAIAKQLSFEGVDVVISSRNLNNLESAAKDISAETGGKVIPLIVDTGDQESVASMIEQAMENAGVDEKELAKRMECPRVKVRNMLGLMGRGLSVRRLALALYVLGASAPILSQKESNGA